MALGKIVSSLSEWVHCATARKSFTDWIQKTELDGICPGDVLISIGLGT